LAARNPSIPAACHTFALTGYKKVDADDMRFQILWQWMLLVFAFDDEDTAEPVATATVVGGTGASGSILSSTPSPVPSFPSPPQYPILHGAFLRVHAAVIESVEDLADPTRAANFFISLCGSARGREIHVHGLPLP